MVTVRVARHGETTWNAAGRYQGRRESPLSELGRAQAQALARALEDKGVRRIVSSPLIRCVATALPLARAVGIAIEEEPLLLEIAHGTWEGRYRDEIKANDPERFYEWKHRPERVHFAGGESVLDVLVRWRAFTASFDPRADTLIVTHDVVVRLAIVEAMGETAAALWRPRVVNAGYAEFRVARGRWALDAECVTSHLDGLAADLDEQAL